MAFGLSQSNIPAPATVVKFVAASTFLLQGLPHIFQGSPVVPQGTYEVVALVCDILNIFVATIAIFFGANGNIAPAPKQP